MIAILLSTVLCAADRSPDADGFVRDWLIGGPYPSYRAEPLATGLDTDFLGGEEDARPYPGLAASTEFKADLSKLIAGIGSVNEWGKTETVSVDATWRVRTFDHGVIGMDKAFGEIDDHFVFYAACYLNVPRAADVVFAVGSDDDHKLWLDRRLLGRQASAQGAHPGDFKYGVHLSAGIHRVLLTVVDRLQGCAFCLQVLDKGGKPVPNLAVLTDTRGVKTALDREIEALRERGKVLSEISAHKDRLAELKDELPGLETRLSAAEKRVADAETSLEAAYAKAEHEYADEHARNAARGMPSTDLPLESATCRSRLCINGTWEASVDGKTWDRVLVPFRFVEPYFFSWFFPVRPIGKDVRGPFRQWEGFEDWKMSPAYCADKVRLRTEFDWDGEGRIQYVADGLIGLATFRVNGTVCGEYDGTIGRVTIPLAPLRKDGNVLEIEIARHWNLRHHRDAGIRGDSYLDRVPEVAVRDIHVKTSWRRALLAAKTEIENASGRTIRAEVRQYAAECGRIRFALPPVQVEIAAGGTGTVKTVGRWSDPKVWGIGGKYGDPDLYDLVTDVFVDGRRTDRHVQTFGFREFWIRSTAFFLNGRRIILQGDVGQPHLSVAKWRDVMWPLLRKDGINVIRLHDGDWWSESVATGADRMGMLLYAQAYPCLYKKGRLEDRSAFGAAEDWPNEPEFAWAKANYERWFRMFRNHPSVVIWSTDNEIWTQAWDSADAAKWNIRNDRIGAMYDKFVKSLDRDLVVTRDGDLGTQNRRQRWFEDPPCDTANYHYPDFDIARQVVNWQKVYEWRPAVFGETLYNSYGAWDKWVGPIPSQVQGKARKVREVAGLYRRLGVPAQIFMGLSGDGFVVRDETGKGNPWGLKGRDEKHVRIPWPATSGRGPRQVGVRIGNATLGESAINWFDPTFPSHVRNAVNDAYRETLIRQSPLREGSGVEVLVEVEPGRTVWSVDAATGVRYGVRADGRGVAWFDFGSPGTYRFESDGRFVERELGDRRGYSSRPGFDCIPRFSLKGAEGGVR